MKPPNNTHTASVKGGETPFETLTMSKEYRRNKYTTLIRTYKMPTPLGTKGLFGLCRSGALGNKDVPL
jgi:hypothetical protein